MSRPAFWKLNEWLRRIGVEGDNVPPLAESVQPVTIVGDQRELSPQGRAGASIFGAYSYNSQGTNRYLVHMIKCLGPHGVDIEAHVWVSSTIATQSTSIRFGFIDSLDETVEFGTINRNAGAPDGTRGEHIMEGNGADFELDQFDANTYAHDRWNQPVQWISSNPLSNPQGGNPQLDVSGIYIRPGWSMYFFLDEKVSAADGYVGLWGIARNRMSDMDQPQTRGANTDPPGSTAIVGPAPVYY